MVDLIDFRLWRAYNHVPSTHKLKTKVKHYINHKDWYKNSKLIIDTMFNGDSNLFIDILACTSIRTSVKRNTVNALDCYYRIKNNKPLNKKYGLADKVIKKNIKRALKGKKIKGKKISKFAECLKGNLDKIVIDTWIMKAFNLERTSPTDRDTRYIEYMIKKIAKNLKMKNAEVQTCLWVYAKNELNGTSFKSYRDFSFYLKQFNQRILMNMKLKQTKLDSF